MATQRGTVCELWRCHVMGLRGEMVHKAEIVEQEILGDRAYVLYHKQNEIKADKRIHETISTKHNNILGAMCNVLREGKIRVGDAVGMLF